MKLFIGHLAGSQPETHIIGEVVRDGGGDTVVLKNCIRARELIANVEQIYTKIGSDLFYTVEGETTVSLDHLAMYRFVESEDEGLFKLYEKTMLDIRAQRTGIKLENVRKIITE